MSKTPKQFELVTIVDNETLEETKGMILTYTPETITIRQLKKYKEGSKLHEKTEITFDAMKVHFKSV